MDYEKQHWINDSVSLKQFAIALIPVIWMYGSLLLQTESRLSRFEERQNINTASIADHRKTTSIEQVANDQKLMELRREILGRLDQISGDMIVLRIALARHESQKK